MPNIASAKKDMRKSRAANVRNRAQRSALRTALRKAQAAAATAEAAFVEAEQLTFPLASDTDKGVLASWGAWGEKTMYGKKVTGTIRSTVVVAPDGSVEHAAYNVKATGHVAKLRRDLGID